MRLAEADYLAAQSADSPILLLDDVFSELDPPRRERTAEAVSAVEQVILTTADPSAIPFDASALTASLAIADGRLRQSPLRVASLTTSAAASADRACNADTSRQS